MSMLPKMEYSSLEKNLGYHFKDRSLLELALTHSSIHTSNRQVGDNERLEFLGDRVLGLVIATLLNEYFSKAREGELARHYNLLVRKETCAEIAREMGLGPYLIMSEGEKKSGGQEKERILGNACEAILGALFLDSDFETARGVISTYWRHRLIHQDSAMIDPKSALQEWALGRRMTLPHYREMFREGSDHQPVFTIEATITGLEPTRGEGTSKRAAEQVAARRLLEREGVWPLKRDGQ